MNVLALLRPLEELELRMADVYEHLSQQFAGDAPASSFFFKLAMEERRHAGMVQHARRLARQNSAQFEEVDADPIVVEGELEAIADLRRRAAELSLAEVLPLALAIERGAAEQHYRARLSKASGDCAKLLDALGSADKEHMSRIERFIDILGSARPAD
jgi:rubrerythrin